MGRIYNKIKESSQKTYSKAFINHDKAQLRKPLPKFENLFLKNKNLKQSSFSLVDQDDRSKTGRKQSYQKKDESDDLFNSLNDTFDALAAMKINVEKSVEKNECKDSEILNSSLENDNFQSACNLTSPDMFASLVKYEKEQQGEENKQIKKQNNIVSMNTPKRSDHKKVKNNLSKDLKEIKNPKPNLITSTPTTYSVTCAKKCKMRKNITLESDLSPVSKEITGIFEISVASEPEANFISCLNNTLNKNDQHLTKPDELKIYNCKVSKQDSDILLKNKLKDCRVHLKRLNSLLNSSKNEESDSDSELFTHPIIDVQRRQGNCYSQGSSRSFDQSFIRVTRRRRCLPAFENKHKKNAPSHFLGSDLKDSLLGDKNKCTRTSSLSENSMQNLTHRTNRSSAASLNSFCGFKTGKGWRRVAKRISNINNLQSPANSFISERNSSSQPSENLSRSSILKSEIIEDKKEEDSRMFVLHLCSQTAEISFLQCLQKRQENCKKIGEGVYGEVFMYYDHSVATPFAENRVLKMMPIEGDFSVNGEPQKTFEEISAEIVVAKALSDLHDGNDNSTSSFVRVYKSWCVKGSYTPELIKMWDAYAENKGSDNDRPDIFPESQLHIVLEFEYAGQELESYVFNNALQTYSVFLQVVFALAVAEEQLEFEHRDLHWGNILIRPTTEAFVSYRLKEKAFKIKSQGVKATVIDFTLSRLRANGRVFFNDLATDPSLFAAEGDYQFDIYRNMQSHNGNNWKKFCPRTNIFWLHYLSLKMLNDCYYKNKSTLVHKDGLKKLKSLSNSILALNSASELACKLQNLNIFVK